MVRKRPPAPRRLDEAERAEQSWAAEPPPPLLDHRTRQGQGSSGNDRQEDGEPKEAASDKDEDPITPPPAFAELGFAAVAKWDEAELKRASLRLRLDGEPARPSLALLASYATTIPDYPDLAAFLAACPRPPQLLLHTFSMEAAHPGSWHLVLRHQRRFWRRPVAVEGLPPRWELEDLLVAAQSTASPLLTLRLAQTEEVGRLELQLHLTPAALTPEPLFGPKSARLARTLCQLIAYVTQGALPTGQEAAADEDGGEDLQALYAALADQKPPLAAADEVAHLDGLLAARGLLPELRPYQRAAVQWMLGRERRQPEDSLCDWSDGSQLLADTLPGLQKGQRHLRWLPQLGLVFEPRPPTEFPGRGGILADEMGLGKTVEVLALAMLNTREGGEEMPAPAGTSDQKPDADNLSKMEAGDPTASSQVALGQAASPDEGGSGVALTLEALLAAVCVAAAAGEEAAPKRPSHRGGRRTRGHGGRKRGKGEEDGDRQAKRRRVAEVDLTEGQLQCLCGGEKSGARMACAECSGEQHLGCVNWDAAWPPGEYLCPQCRAEEHRPLIKSGATLIISPASLAAQWAEEARRHCRPGALSVYAYEGMAREGYRQPRDLAAFRLVLTTYEALRAELPWADEGRQGGLRARKRYCRARSPLTAVSWWRVCADEAQMVEGGSSKAAEMCRRLTTAHLWCVTGTPVQRSLADLAGLLRLLRLGRTAQPFWWEVDVWAPYRRGELDKALQPLRPVLWRTEKRQVRDELRIPPQTSQVKWVHFTPIEEHFYRRTLATVAAEARQAIHRARPQGVPEAEWLANPLSALAPALVERIMGRLLHLRHACSYPNLSRTGRLMPNQRRRAALTMEEVLRAMLDDTKTEAEAEQRLLLAAHNGNAGLHWLRGHLPEALASYRAALHATQERRIDSDPLQLIHTYRNLHQLLRLPEARAQPTLRDDRLLEDADRLRDKYLRASVLAEAAEAAELGRERDEVEERLGDSDDWLGWTQAALRHWEGLGEGDFVMDKVRSALEKESPNVDGKEYRSQLHLAFRDPAGLAFVLQQKWEALGGARRTAVEALARLLKEDPDGLERLEEPSHCHLQPALKALPALGTCALCRAEGLVRDYENCLFREADVAQAEQVRAQRRQRADLRGAGRDQEEDRDKEAEASWKDSALQVALRALLQLAGRGRGEQWRALAEAGRSQLDALDAMKRELRCGRKAWMELCRGAALRDELAMAGERLKLASPDERELMREAGLAAGERGGEWAGYIDSLASVPALMASNEADIAAATRNRDRKLGSLAYLRNLHALEEARAESGEGSGGNKEECPICRGELGSSWAVLGCAHCLCNDCVRLCAERSPQVDSVRSQSASYRPDG